MEFSSKMNKTASDHVCSMNKIFKMAAIASVVIALFASCSTDKKEPVDVHVNVNVMAICISRTELTRAFADPIPDGAVP